MQSTAIRLRLVGDPAARRRLASLLRRRAALTVTAGDDALVVDVPLAYVERAGPSIEARAIEANLELWLDDLDALVPAAELNGYGSRIWAAIGDAVVRNELAADRGDEPDTDLFAFVRVSDRDGVAVAEDARAPWEPGELRPMFGPSHWDDIPSIEEVAAAVGPGSGPVFIEMRPDGPPFISRPEATHDDPELEGLLPPPRPGEHWSHVESRRDPSDRRLRRGLKELGVDRRSTSEVFALHGSGRGGVLGARLHRVPGATASDLGRVFSTTVLGFTQAPWSIERVAALDVLVSHDTIDGVEEFGVMTTGDGLVAIFSGNRTSVEALLTAFLEAQDRNPA